MVEFFIAIFIFAWKLTFLLIGVVILIFVVYWLLYAVGMVTQPFLNFLLAPFKLFGVKTWEERKQEYKHGKEPSWFDKINLWMEGNEKQ